MTIWLYSASRWWLVDNDEFSTASYWTSASSVWPTTYRQLARLNMLS